MKLIVNLILINKSARIHFIHLEFCLTTGPKPLPKRALHLVQSKASSFKWQYPLLSLVIQQLLTSSSSSSYHFYPAFIFPSITRCRRQFLHKMWPNQLAFRLLISCSIFLCYLTLSNTSSFPTWSVQLSSILLQVFPIYCTNRPSFSTIKAMLQM